MLQGCKPATQQSAPADTPQLTPASDLPYRKTPTSKTRADADEFHCKTPALAVPRQLFDPEPLSDENAQTIPRDDNRYVNHPELPVYARWATRAVPGHPKGQPFSNL